MAKIISFPLSQYCTDASGSGATSSYDIKSKFAPQTVLVVHKLFIMMMPVLIFLLKLDLQMQRLRHLLDLLGIIIWLFMLIRLILVARP